MRCSKLKEEVLKRPVHFSKPGASVALDRFSDEPNLTPHPIVASSVQFNLRLIWPSHSTNTVASAV